MLLYLEYYSFSNCGSYFMSIFSALILCTRVTLKLYLHSFLKKKNLYIHSPISKIKKNQKETENNSPPSSWHGDGCGWSPRPKISWRSGCLKSSRQAQTRTKPQAQNPHGRSPPPPPRPRYLRCASSRHVSAKKRSSQQPGLGLGIF